MPLTATKLHFLRHLGIDLIGDAEQIFNVFQEIEEDVISAIDEVARAGADKERVARLEQAVQEAQQCVPGAKNLDALSETVHKACTLLNGVKREVDPTGEVIPYLRALKQARAWRSKLLLAPVLHPVFSDQAQIIQTRCIDPAIALARQGLYSYARLQLAAVKAEVEQACRLADEYDRHLGLARAALDASRSMMPPQEALRIRETMLDAACEMAQHGHYQAALKLLDDVEPSCRSARQAQFDVAARKVTGLLDSLKVREVDAKFARETAQLEAGLQTIREAALEGVATPDLWQKLYRQTGELEELAHRHGTYRTEVEAITQTVLALHQEGSFNSSKALADLDPIRKGLAVARDQASGHAYEVALATLEKVVGHLTLLGAVGQLQYQRTRSLLKAPHARREKVTQQLQALCELPRGLEALDDLIQRMGPGDPKAHVQLAIAVRFNLNAGVIDEEAGTPQAASMVHLKRLHNVMLIPPAEHLRLNREIRRVKFSSRQADYHSPSKTITVRTLPEALEYSWVKKPPYPTDPLEPCLGSPLEVPDLQARYAPDPDTAAPKAFDLVLLHEVGHAVDERYQYMNKSGMLEGFGGWQVHGRRTDHVARAVAKAFGIEGIDADCIEQYLDDEEEPKNPPEGWALVKAWADDVRHAKSPWNDGHRCAKPVREEGFIADGRIYHEAYEDHWVSYLATARHRGLTGYQFRSVGEWFAETYAAYALGQLKGEHPANEWLDPLFGNAAA